MASGGRVERGSRPRARAASVVVPLPRRVTGERLDLVRLVPSGQSLGIALLILLGGVGAWLGARETGVFAVRTIEVVGVPAPLAAQVRKQLATAKGTSLLKVDLAASAQAVETIPAVAEARFDRAYPHTLRVVISPEKPVAVVRQGSESFLVAASGKVIGPADRTDRPSLARIWVKRSVELLPGATAQGDLLTAVSAVTPIAGSRFPWRVSAVTAAPDALRIRLRSGLELRLGYPTDVTLKLAIAARIIPLLDPGTVYLDVSVPERPVAGTLNSQVELEGSATAGA